jgi:hypothetical protein
VGQVANWSALAFRFAPLLSPPMPATAEAQTLVAIGPDKFVFQKNKRQVSNKDFSRGQVNGFADNLATENQNLGLHLNCLQDRLSL